MNVHLNILDNIQKWADGKVKTHDKAIATGLKEAAIFLRKEGKNSLRKGFLELKPRQPYRNEPGYKGKKGARLPMTKKAKSTIPLVGLAPGIGYSVKKSDNMAEIGFLGKGFGKASSLAALAKRHQRGYTINVTPEMRRKMAGKFIFMRKTTTSIAVPARDIVQAIGVKHGDQTLRMLKTAYSKVMA